MENIYCLSVSHRYSNVDVRSKYGLVFQDLESRVKELKSTGIVREAVIISTCNRLEIVFLGNDIDAVMAWIGFKCSVDHEEVKSNFKVMQSMEALKHIYRVLSGLDSKIFGETNIAGQVKQSLEVANNHQLASRTLNFIYQDAYRIAKKIHCSLALPINSLANCFEKAFEKHFPDPRRKVFVTVGSGKLCVEIVKKIMKYEPRKIYIISRNPERVDGFLREVASHIGMLDDIANNLPDVDACFTATNVAETVINPTHLDLFNKNKNIFISDSSLPPVVCPTVRNYQNITYYDIDDLALLSEQKDNLITTSIEDELNLFIEASIFELCKALNANFMTNIIQPERTHLKEYIDHIQAWVSEEQKKNPEKKMSLVIKDLSGVLLHITTLFLKECCKHQDANLVQELHNLIDKHDAIIKNAIDDK